jgi:hypothetical protein
MIYTREDKEEIQPNKVRSSELIPVERWTQVQQARTCVVVLTLKYVTIVSYIFLKFFIHRFNLLGIKNILKKLYLK